MTTYNELAKQLRSGSRAKASLAGLDEDYLRATDKVDNTKSKVDKYGQVSPLMVLSDVLRQSSGRKKMRELSPQRVNARQGIADNENAAALYTAGVNADAVTYAQKRNAEQDVIAANAAVQKQTNTDNLALAKVAAARLENTNKVLGAKTLAGVNTDAAGVATGVAENVARKADENKVASALTQTIAKQNAAKLEADAKLAENQRLQGNVNDLADVKKNARKEKMKINPDTGKVESITLGLDG